MIDTKQLETFLKTPALKCDVVQIYLRGTLSKHEFQQLFNKHCVGAKAHGIIVESFDQAWATCKQIEWVRLNLTLIE